MSKPKPPIPLEQQQWTDSCFLRLASLLGAGRLLDARVVLPTPEFFPDPYDRSDQSLQLMFSRVATLMQFNPNEIEVSLFADGQDLTHGLVPFYSGKTSAAGGLYFHRQSGKPHISVNEAELKDPIALVAVLAHELGHVILLRPGLINPDDPEMEPLNDLLTVFLGFGVFTANSAFRFEQHSDTFSQGWSARNLGYLSERVLGYALARFAYERGEKKPAWRSFLSVNIGSFMRQSATWLANAHESRLFAGAHTSGQPSP